MEIVYSFFCLQNIMWIVFGEIQLKNSFLQSAEDLNLKSFLFQRKPLFRPHCFSKSTNGSAILVLLRNHISLARGMFTSCILRLIFVCFRFGCLRWFPATVICDNLQTLLAFRSVSACVLSTKAIRRCHSRDSGVHCQLRLFALLFVATILKQCRINACRLFNRNH